MCGDMLSEHRICEWQANRMRDLICRFSSSAKNLITGRGREKKKKAMDGYVDDDTIHREDPAS